MTSVRWLGGSDLNQLVQYPSCLAKSESTKLPAKVRGEGDGNVVEACGNGEVELWERVTPVGVMVQVLG